MFFRLPNGKYLRYDIEERWERLNIRKWINDNPRIIISITAASAFVFLLIVIGQLMPGKALKFEENEKAWFYDLNTGELFVAKSSKIPPIKAPSGPLANGEPAGVKAHVFSYSCEPNQSSRFIGFLETLTPEAKKHMSAFLKSRDNVTKESIKEWNQGRLIRRITDEKWFSADSNEGRAILKEIFLPNEDGNRARYCPPK